VERRFSVFLTTRQSSGVLKGEGGSLFTDCYVDGLERLVRLFDLKRPDKRHFETK
jgi:hypothetical protein